jgi:hypothetical protein
MLHITRDAWLDHVSAVPCTAIRDAVDTLNVD